MSSYYTGRRARHYNRRWRTYARKTLAEVQARGRVSSTWAKEESAFMVGEAAF